ncbi:pilus (MSHA type) biogenesis protein MshL [Teredinibacter haidensis]|mgnify:CR=1 FL=1|uniref:pilus (MSHA type) biogenesis protein MshL n=1 Tax=Teredinibacter haidensis TaxID=2731755 RepID=UPI000948CFB6|nr:pilus (MSHA type) biogenesis protein MshL [Teredinibacter haidensis]
MKVIQTNFQLGKWLLVKLFTVTILTSCSSIPQDQTPAEKAMESSVAAHESYKQSQRQDVPEDISANLLNTAAGLSSTGSLSRAAEERFDISVNLVPARTFFLSLVADSGVNVVAHPEVSGFISLELKGVTIREVLNVTRDVYGYEYKLGSSIYTIYPRKLRTEVFPINYLDIQRVGVTDTSVSIGKISSDSSQGNSNGGNRSSGSSQGDSENLLGYIDNNKSSSGRSSGLTPGARIQTLNRTDFWSSVAETITAIIGSDAEGRMVMTSPQSGLVVVKALPNELSAVRKFLERAELSVKRQVVLETKILEVKLNDGFEAGIDWGAIGGSLALARTRSNQDGVLDESILSSVDGALSEAFRRTDTQNFTDTEVVSGVLDVLDLTQLLMLLETQGNVQVLSSPRISTVNNQKAIIRVGSDEFFVTGISNNTTTSASSIQNIPEVELESFFSGIALDVTPQIAEDGDVILHVHPIVSHVEDQIKEINVGDSLFSLPLALRDVRESDSIVRAKSGQIVVLGGLMQESTTDVAGKRPFLGDIPVVNSLFKTRQTKRVKTELVILMRPIVVDENTWEEELSRTTKNIGGMSDTYRARE